MPAAAAVLPAVTHALHVMLTVHAATDLPHVMLTMHSVQEPSVAAAVLPDGAAAERLSWWTVAAQAVWAQLQLQVAGG